jgi:hypothetical protein
VCAAIEQVARKPSQSKRWRIAAPKRHCTCLHQIVYDRAVEFCNEVFLQPAAVGGGESCLVDVYLDSDRHAGQGTRVVSAGQHTVHPVCLLSHQIRSAVDDRVDPRVDGVEPLQRCLGYLTGRHFACPYKASDFAC